MLRATKQFGQLVDDLHEDVPVADFGSPAGLGDVDGVFAASLLGQGGFPGFEGGGELLLDRIDSLADELFLVRGNPADQAHQVLQLALGAQVFDTELLKFTGVTHGVQFGGGLGGDGVDLLGPIGGLLRCRVHCG
jgi:hypothetical protein